MTRIVTRGYKEEDGEIPFMKSVTYNGPIVTGIAEDKPVFIAGVRIFWEGMGEPWVHFLEPAARYPYSYFVLKEELNKAIQTYNLNRVEANAYDAAGCNFLEHMGFVRQCVRRKMGPNGADCVLYARVKE